MQTSQTQKELLTEAKIQKESTNTHMELFTFQKKYEQAAVLEQKSEKSFHSSSSDKHHSSSSVMLFFE